jgi:hypothetical protein
MGSTPFVSVTEQVNQLAILSNGETRVPAVGRRSISPAKEQYLSICAKSRGQEGRLRDMPLVQCCIRRLANHAPRDKIVGG